MFSLNGHKKWQKWNYKPHKHIDKLTMSLTSLVLVNLFFTCLTRLLIYLFCICTWGIIIYLYHKFIIYPCPPHYFQHKNNLRKKKIGCWLNSSAATVFFFNYFLFFFLPSSHVLTYITDKATFYVDIYIFFDYSDNMIIYLYFLI